MLSTSRGGPGQRQRTAALSALTVGVAFLIAACSGSPDQTTPSTTAPGSSPAASGAPVASGDDAPASPQIPSSGSSAAPATPGPTLPRVAPLQPPAYASRVVVEDLGIDLPVISGDLQPPPSYPLCDVAAYVTRFGQPYETGVTYISAHAQEGMFAPLLSASERADGAELVGMNVQVFVSDGRRFDYAIERVVRHAVDYAVLGELGLDDRILILQTSEGVYGTPEKLQVIAALESETTVEPAVAAPEPMPRDCRPDELINPRAG